MFATCWGAGPSGVGVQWAAGKAGKGEGENLDRLLQQFRCVMEASVEASMPRGEERRWSSCACIPVLRMYLRTSQDSLRQTIGRSPPCRCRRGTEDWDSVKLPSWQNRTELN